MLSAESYAVGMITFTAKVKSNAECNLTKPGSGRRSVVSRCRKT